ncbi:MAG: CpaF family protein [Coriobacteriia bacterium]|nr:CpaF family protein [Coriobacteriia bacterium]
MSTVCDKTMRDKLRERLYERISPEQITREVAHDAALARKQIFAYLQQILAAGAVPQLAPHQHSAAAQEVVCEILGFGPIDELLADEHITEIMVNGADCIFFERGGRLYPSSATFEDDEALRGIIDRIISPLGRRIDEQTPIVNARLAEGHRVHAVIPPLALDGPTLTIRKFRSRIYSLSELSTLGALPVWLAQLLHWAVRSRLNIAVTGGTGSGKTTLLNALSLEIPHGERIITIEDSAELKFHAHPHVVRLESRAANIEGSGEISIRDLAIASLRMRPDRIVVGEVRGAEALEMLQAMNTGHDGSLTTAHANSPHELVARLVTMVGYGSDMGTDQITSQITAAIDLVVHQARLSDGSRKITSVCELIADTDTGYKVVEVAHFNQEGVGDDGVVVGEMSLNKEPDFLASVVARGVATEEEVDAWKCLTR